MSIQCDPIQSYLLSITEYNRRKLRNQGPCLSKTKKEDACKQDLTLQEDTWHAAHPIKRYMFGWRKAREGQNGFLR
jgi:hypothetical protein